MPRPLEDLGPEHHRTYRAWARGTLTVYGALLLALVALMVNRDTNQQVASNRGDRSLVVATSVSADVATQRKASKN